MIPRQPKAAKPGICGSGELAASVGSLITPAKQRLALKAPLQPGIDRKSPGGLRLGMPRPLSEHLKRNLLAIPQGWNDFQIGSLTSSSSSNRNFCISNLTLVFIVPKG